MNSQELATTVSKMPWLYKPLIWTVNKLALTLSLFLLWNCSLRKPLDGELTYPLRSKLEKKVKLYKSMLSQTQDAYGFVGSEHCDSSLFSGLLGTVEGTNVNLEAARTVDGKWRRRSVSKPCYPKHSKSSISRDMFVGIMWWMWRNERLDLAEDLFDYGRKHNWIMGEGLISRTYFSPQMQATLAELIYKLGGKNHKVYRSIPQVYAKNIDFPAHLDVLHILLRGELTGGVSKRAMKILEHQYKRVPQNALFSYGYHKYTDGNMLAPTVSLLNTKWFPANRLPTRGDRKAFWLWERDKNGDWEPADDPYKKHSGGDLLFVANLVLEKSK